MRSDPNPKIRDKVVKNNWDASKSPAANLAEMGLLARPNQHASSNDKNEAVEPAAKAHVIELFDVPVLCQQSITMGSKTVDFLRKEPKDHGIEK